jgi:hypothetical protein
MEPSHSVPPNSRTEHILPFQLNQPCHLPSWHLQVANSPQNQLCWKDSCHT